MWDERKSNSEKQAKNSSGSNYQKTSTIPTKTSRHKSSMDTINFEYRTAEGIEGNYTVQVYKGITGNIHGWCDEREDTREFRIDRIKNDSITRVETGEIMTVKEWRKLMRENNIKKRALTT